LEDIINRVILKSEIGLQTTMTFITDSTLQLILAIRSGGAVSALISVGVFVGTTRTRLKKLEESLENVKKDVKEYTQLNVTATKMI
jgi:hypothetical protein